jgi:hypothetical protein
LEKVPVCAKCGARADSSFKTYRLNISGKDLIKWVALVYCTSCGSVQGIVNL